MPLEIITSTSPSTVTGSSGTDTFIFSGGTATVVTVNGGGGDDEFVFVPSALDNRSFIVFANDLSVGDSIKIAFDSSFTGFLNTTTSVSSIQTTSLTYIENSVSSDALYISDTIAGSFDAAIFLANTFSADQFILRHQADASPSTTLTLVGTGGASITGSASADQFVGSFGGDTVDGGSGDDTLFGKDGGDVLSGGDGADVLYGNIDLDDLHGNGGNDTLYGGQNAGEPSLGESTISARRNGVESLSGGDGDDLLYGNHGTDILEGGTGNDTLFGGQDADTLRCGEGADRLNGNLGNDVLFGGTGADTFIIRDGADRIEDFTIAEGDLLSAATRTGVTDGADGAIVTFSDGSSVTLVGVAAASVTDAIFV